jgi:hypothetical protein
MCTTRLQRDIAGRAASACLLLCLLLVAAHARSVVGQADMAAAAPKEVADFFVQLLTAKRVDVKTLLGAAQADLPYFRLRLYVAPTVPGPAGQAVQPGQPAQSWTGIDYDLQRDAKETHRIELAAPKSLFRDSLNEALRDPLAVSTDPKEAGVRIVDVWCLHSGGAGGHVPLMAKVWINSQAAGLVDGNARTFDSGRLCHEDLPKLAECLRLLDASSMIEQQDTPTLSADPDAAAILADAIAIHRADITAFTANPVGDAIQTTLEPGQGVIEWRGTQNLPAGACDHQQTVPRMSPYGESFIGLASDARAGTATITLELPFASGGAAVWAPARIAEETARLEVEASSDGRAWTPLYQLDAEAMQDKGRHVLPASILQESRFMIRARLTTRDSTAGPTRERSVRFLAAAQAFSSSFRITCESDVLRVLRREPPIVVAPYHLRLEVQPTVLDTHGVSALVREGDLEADVYAPCELDQDTCRDIGNHRGVIRFWSPSPWHAHPSDWQAEMVSGPGWLAFPRMKKPPLALATALAAGKKSLSFPDVQDPSCELLQTLAGCSGELALDGMTELTPEQSRAISQYRGPKLSLRGLRKAHCVHPCPESLLRAVVESPGTCTLSGLTELDEATAKLLAAGRKHLILDDVVSLSAAVAEVLSLIDQGLSLNAVTTLDQAAAGKLLTFSGEFLSLAGLRDVQCGIDDLSAPDGRRPRSLRSLLMPSQTAELEAGAKKQAHKQALLEDLEAMFQELVAKGIHPDEDREDLFAAASESDEALEGMLALNRVAHPELQTWCKVRIGNAGGTPLDAFVRSRGVVTLQPQLVRAIVKNRFNRAVADKSLFNRAVAESLARGQKHLKLDCLVDRDLTPEIATVLAACGTIVSLDGIQSIPPGVAAPLAQYQGPLLSLAGVKEVAPEDEALLLPLVEANRASLPEGGMLNIAGLRDFVLAIRRGKGPETADRRVLYDGFLDRSKKREWAVQMPAAKPRVQTVLLLPNDVEFDDGRQKIRAPRARLTPVSLQTLGKLQDDAKAVAAIRKEDLLKDSQAK